MSFSFTNTVNLIKMQNLLRQKQQKERYPQLPLIEIGNIRIPNSLETKGLLCVGANESDRLELIFSVIDKLKQRPDYRGIILDHNGELLKRFYDPLQDYIFNPRDVRSIAWCHKNEKLDGYHLASSLVDNNGLFFTEATKKVITDIYNYSDTNEEVWQKLNVLPPKDLAKSGLVLELCDTHTIDTIISSLRSYTKFHKYLNTSDSFSFYEWGRNDEPGWIFIPWFDDSDKELIPLYQMVVGLSLQGLLSREGKEDFYLKTAVVIENLDNFRLNNLTKFLNQSHRCKGYPLLGMQTLAEVVNRYGERNAQIILFNMEFKLIFNCFSMDFTREECKETAEIMAKFIGLERGKDHKISYKVSPSLLMSLLPLQGYLNIDESIVKMQTKSRNRLSCHEPFIPTINN